MFSNHSTSSVKIVTAAIIASLTLAGCGTTEPTATTAVPPIAVTPPPTTIAQPTNAAQKTGLLTAGANKVAFQYPNAWGELQDFPKNPAEGEQFKASEHARVPLATGTNLPESADIVASDAKTFASYPYFVASNSWYVNGTTIGAFEYPAQFLDDCAKGKKQGDVGCDGMWASLPTAAQKQGVIDPLIQIYNQKSLQNVAIDWIGSKSKSDEKPIQFGIWGNIFAVQERVGARYIQNKAGTLRGVAYFATEGQDLNFNPAYVVVLINPEKRLIISVYLPLAPEKLAELKPFNLQDSDAPAISQEKVQKGYTYLDNPANYATTELGTFVKNVDAMIASLQI